MQTNFGNTIIVGASGGRLDPSFSVSQVQKFSVFTRNASRGGQAGGDQTPLLLFPNEQINSLKAPGEHFCIFLLEKVKQIVPQNRN